MRRPLTPLPIDPSLAEQRFTFSRYCANGLIAGGGATALWLILGSVTIHYQSYVALHVLFYGLFVGGLVFMLNGLRFGGYKPRWSAYLLPALVFLLGMWTVGIEVAYHTTNSLPPNNLDWWGLVGKAVLAVIIGTGMRFWAEGAEEDMQLEWSEKQEELRYQARHRREIRSLRVLVERNNGSRRHKSAIHTRP